MARRDHDSKRIAILLAVLRVVGTRGLGAVSIRSVAAEAGVSVGRVQHYFASKRELIRATVAFRISAAEARHVDVEQARPPEDELWALLGHGIPLAADAPVGTSVFYSFVAASVADPEIAGILAEAKAGVEGLVAQLLGELNSALTDPLEKARRLIALSDGLTLQVLIGHLTAAQARECLRAALEDLDAVQRRAPIPTSQAESTAAASTGVPREPLPTSRS